MREALQNQTKLVLSNKQYIIHSCIGMGASCLVYEASYIDDIGIERKVRIKECYPLHCCESKRKGNEIIWKKDQEKELLEFEKIYKRHIYFQNMNSLSNSTSLITDCLYSANQTKYIIMDCLQGKTFDKIVFNQLQDILKVALTLSKFVKKYHDQGYILCDIKPENFLVLDETYELIKYLDYDSIISLSQLDAIQSLSYSKPWAATELMQGNMHQISIQSDFYSIGAIVYYKIFHSFVSARQRSIGFNPDYTQSQYTKHIHPACFEYLTRFFNKTLNNRAKRRYQSDEELIKDLEKLVELSNPHLSYLVSSNIEQRIPFIGRKQELLQIKETFEQGKSIIIVNGCGGIGKTELVKNFAINNPNGFHTIVFGKCENGLKDLFMDDSIFMITNDHSATFEEKMKRLKIIVDSHTLLIIDNLDILEDPALQVLFSLPCKLLITTRRNLNGIFSDSDSTMILSLNSMTIQDQETLFYSYYKKNHSSQESQSISKMIQYIGGLPLMIPILAKQLIVSDVSPVELEQQLSMLHLKGISDTLIKHFKDNQLINDTAYNQAAQIMHEFYLSEHEKQLLFVMALLGNVKIGRKTLASLTGIFKEEIKSLNYYKYDTQEYMDICLKNADIKEVNDLIEKGYFQYDSVNDIITCHNIIREISLYEFGYTIEQVPHFKNILNLLFDKLEYDFFEENCLDLTELVHVHDFIKMDMILSNTYTELLKQVILNMDITNKENRIFLFQHIFGFLFFQNQRNIHYIENMKQQLHLVSLTKKETLQFMIFELEEAFINRNGNCTSLIFKLIEESKKDKDICFQFFSLLYACQDIENFSFLDDNTLNILYDSCDIYEQFNLEDEFDILLDEQDIRDATLKALQMHEETKQKTEKKEFIEKKEEKKEENYDFSKIYDTYFDILINPDIHFKDKPDFCCERSYNEMRDLLHKNIWYNQQNKIEIKPTNKDIEYTATLSVIARNSDYFHHCHNSEYDAYEYYARNNSFMFLFILLDLIEIYGIESSNIDLGTPFEIYPLHYHIDLFLENHIKDPYFTLETLKLFCKTVITPENIEYTKNDIHLSGYQDNTMVLSFFEDCEIYAKKYNDPKLKQIVLDTRKNISGLDIAYDDYEISQNPCLDSTKLFEEVRSLFKKIIQGNCLKEEIVDNPFISHFYKNCLLNCFDIQLTTFDILYLDYECIPSFYFGNKKYLEQCLNKEENCTGLEKQLILQEICFQYGLLEDEDKEWEYVEKLEIEIKNQRLYHGHMNYIAYCAAYIFIHAILVANPSHFNIAVQFVEYLISNWCMGHLDDMNYFEFECINSITEEYIQILESIQFKKESNQKTMKIYTKEFKDIYTKQRNYIKNSFIPENYLLTDSDRLEGVYTDQRKDEYLNKCHEIQKKWKEENHSREEYLEMYKSIFNECFPFPDDWEEDFDLPLHEYIKKHTHMTIESILNSMEK